MNRTQRIVISILAVATLCIVPLIALIDSPRPPASTSEQQADDGWQVEHVGGMAFDKHNSNVYLTSSAANSTANNTTTGKCLIRMLSFSAEKGFASMNHGILPKTSGGLPEDAFLASCPRDPRCIVRRHLQEDFQQVDESLYPDTCSNIYIENDQAVILGRLSHEIESMPHHGGSVMVMKLGANKLGGDEVQHIRMHEEPLVAALYGEDTIYLASHTLSDPRSIILYRYMYSRSNGSWHLDWKTNQEVSEYGHRVDIASLNVVLGGHYLILAGTVTRGHGQSSGHFGIYRTRDGSIVDDVLGHSSVLEEAHAQKHDIECVCFDEEQSDSNVAILYRVSTVVVLDKTFTIVNKLRIEKNNETHRTQQSPVWTQEIMHVATKKCQVTNEALMLAGYIHSYNTPAALTIAKRSKLNGAVLWTSHQTTLSDNSNASQVQLADMVVDNQSNVLVYGQLSDDSGLSSNGDDDIVLLLALHGGTGQVLAQTEKSPPMVARQIGSTSSGPLPRSWNIVPREELMSNYQVPFAICIVGMVVSTLLIIWIVHGARANSQEQERKIFQQRAMNIFSYLRPFDSKEVDIQQSPTGGFNATYTDDLINKGSHTDTEKESLLNESASRSLSSQL
ncbi:MAG: hypothetical protein SGBAC_012277 [Bacillariaceae sp.]